MKTKVTKHILLIAALAVAFTACEYQSPFDTQSEDDAPLILKPYNESGTGSFTYNLANPDIPLLDSVTVTPSNYTTVKWYLDGTLVYTGLRIEINLQAGTYALRIEAETTGGKRTERTGSVTVHPYDTDPYSAAPAIGRHEAPGTAATLDGANLTKVKSILLTNDLMGQDVAYVIAPEAATDAQLTFTLPAAQDGRYYVRFTDQDDKIYGANMINVHSNAVVLEGYEEFIPASEWTISGLNLTDVAIVKVGSYEINDLITTAKTVTFTAPDVAEGSFMLSMKTASGEPVQFITADGEVDEIATKVSNETVLWTGPVALDWDAALVNITAAQMNDVPLGSTIIVYYEVPSAEYHNMRITTPWWGDDLVAQFDVIDGVTPNPFTFVYDERCQGIVNTVGSWSIVGFGETINKVTYK